MTSFDVKLRVCVLDLSDLTLCIFSFATLHRGVCGAGDTRPISNCTFSRWPNNQRAEGETWPKAKVKVPRSLQPFLHYRNAGLRNLTITGITLTPISSRGQRIVIQEAIGLMRGHNFGWKAFWNSNRLG